MKYSKTKKVFRKTKERKTVSKKRFRTYKGGDDNKVTFYFTVNLALMDTVYRDENFKKNMRPVILNSKTGNMLTNEKGEQLVPGLAKGISNISNVLRHINTFRPNGPTPEEIIQWYNNSIDKYLNQTNAYGTNFKIDGYFMSKNNTIYYGSFNADINKIEKESYTLQDVHRIIENSVKKAINYVSPIITRFTTSGKYPPLIYGNKSYMVTGNIVTGNIFHTPIIYPTI